MTNVKKTIVFAWLHNNVGGLQRLIVTRTRWFVGQGYEVIIVTTDGPMIREYAEAGAEIVSFSRHECDFSALGDSCFRAKIREADAVISDDAEVIYYVGYDKKSSWTLTQMAAFRPVAKVRFILEQVALKIFYDFKAEELGRLAAGRQIVCINDASRRYLNRHIGLALSDETIVPIPVPFSLSIENSHPIGAHGPIVVTATRLEEMKEYVFGMIRQSPAFFSEFPEARLLIVGDGTYMKMLRALPQAQDKRVIFAGTVPPASFNEAIGRGTVFVGMGTAAVQAAALGMPVVLATAYVENFTSPGYFSEQASGNFGEEDEERGAVSGWDLVNRLLRDRKSLENELKSGRRRASEVFSLEENMRLYESRIKMTSAGVPDLTPPTCAPGAGWKRWIKKLLIELKIR